MLYIMNKVIIIGGGAAGLMAGVAASHYSNDVTIYDGNEKLGKKMYITGKGRCNLTNACDISDYFENIVSNGKFLYSALYGFTNDDMIRFFEENGCPVKIERGNRAFPKSDKSSDVIKTLERYIKGNGVNVVLNTKVQRILTDNNKVTGVKLVDGTIDKADCVIIATGGLSYNATGSTGDGLAFAKKLGHTVTPTRPALVPFNVKEAYIRAMQGLSLRNVKLSIYNGKKRIYDDFGEMLFTHFGVSGPLVLSASSVVGSVLSAGNIAGLSDLADNNSIVVGKEASGTLTGVVDIKPALSDKQLDDRIIRDINTNKNKELKFLISGLVPNKMVDVIIDMLNVSPHLKLNELTKETRKALVNLLKGFTFTVTGLRDYNEAIITQGGVSTSEINSSTMESKLVKGLYFAGEVIDVDALTGGYNMQIAFSTGYLAGSSAVAEKINHSK